MAKTTDQIYAERRQKIEERRKYLIENPEVYQRDFDEAFKNYLMREYPERPEGLDPEDCDNRFDPSLWEDFANSPEGRGLAIKYSLQEAWNPYGDELPSPSNFSSVRIIRRQDDRIWQNQIRKDSIINLAPYKHFGRFLIVEIDLSYPQREINADLRAWVHQELKELKITELETGSHHELVERPEPRDRDGSHTYKPMEVWKMVERDRQTHNEDEIKNILWKITQTKTRESTDPTDEEKWQREERRIYNALINAYERDKELYYGGPIFRGISK